MAHIEPPRQTKAGIWWTRVRYRTGGRGSQLQSEPICGYASEKECLEAAGHWANDFERRKYLDQLTPAEAGSTITCGELVEAWMEHHVDEELAENSQDYYGRAVAIYFTAYFGDERLTDVTPLDARRWRKWLQGTAAARVAEAADGRAPAAKETAGEPAVDQTAEAAAGAATVTKMIALGRGIFTFAQEMGWRPDNPLETLRPPKQPKQAKRAAARKRKWAPQAVQVEAIRRVISQKRANTKQVWVIARDRLLVSMMGYEACRQEELYGARWWQLVDDDGDVRKSFVIGDGKTRAAEREVKLWRQVREEIRAYYELLGRPPLDSLVFPGIRGAEMSRQNWRRDVWVPALADVLLLPGFERLAYFRPHRLRACAATMLGYALTPQHVALDFLGHEQWTTTAKYYLVAFKDSEELDGVSVEEQIELAREESTARRGAPHAAGTPSAATAG